MYTITRCCSHFRLLAPRELTPQPYSQGLEDSLDECIDETMRTIDQMCFSSQYYMMNTIHVSGMVLYVLGVEVSRRTEVNI